jgi:hypothetical protein
MVLFGMSKVWEDGVGIFRGGAIRFLLVYLVLCLRLRDVDPAICYGLVCGEEDGIWDLGFWGFWIQYG